MEKIANYINGELVAPISGKYIDNYNPSKGEVYSLIPDSDEEDVNMATKAAQAAFPAWSKTPKEK
ncbi:MAG: aldehyde dehydrogenase family protein, partial [Vicingaceae bacterium]